MIAVRRKGHVMNNLKTRLLVPCLFAVLLCLFPSISAAAKYDVKLKLKTEDTFEAIQFDVNYIGAGGEFDGIGGAVDCVANGDTGAITVFNDKDSTKILSVSLMAFGGVEGQIRLATCTFDAAVKPSGGDFVIDELDFSSESGATAVWVKVSNVSAQ